MIPRRSIEEWADRLVVPLYQGQYLQTIWNAYNLINRLKGWTLKNNTWAMWFYNMRPFGNSPELFLETCCAMSDLTAEHDEDVWIGIEMAGVPLVGGTAAISLARNGIPRRFGYTRPLPEKARTPMEALEILRKISAEFTDKYGEKQFVEARLRDGDKIAVFDDMANDLGSKLIGRLITLWHADQLAEPVEVSCRKLFYTLNRNPGNKQKAVDFGNNTESGLYPEPLEAHYIIKINDHLHQLETAMRPDEYSVFCDFQKNSGHFQDPDVQKEVLALVAKAA